MAMEVDGPLGEACVFLGGSGGQQPRGLEKSLPTGGQRSGVRQGLGFEGGQTGTLGRQAAGPGHLG